MICATCAVVCASPQHVVSMIGRIALRYSAESSGSCVLCSRYFSSSALLSRYWCSMYSSYDSRVPNVRSSASGTLLGMTVTGFMNDIRPSVRDAHEFGFGEEVQRPAAAFAAEAAHPDAAERLAQIAQKVAVDPAHTGAHALRERHPVRPLVVHLDLERRDRDGVRAARARRYVLDQRLLSARPAPAVRRRRDERPRPRRRPLVAGLLHRTQTRVHLVLRAVCRS